MNKKSNTGKIVIFLIFTVLMILTFRIGFSSIPTGERNLKFWIALIYVIFLESLALGYFLVPLLPSEHKDLIAALYPTIGILSFLYIGLGLLITILFYRVDSVFYWGLPIISILYLILLGALTIFYGKKNESDTQLKIEKEKSNTINYCADEIYQTFLEYRSKFDINKFREVDAKLRRILEAFRFTTPFGHPGPESPRLEADIQNSLNDLRRIIGQIQSAGEPDLGILLDEIERTATHLLQTLDNRDRLMVR